MVINMPKNNQNPNYLNFEEDLNTYIKEDEFPDVKIIRETTKEEIEKVKKIFSRTATPALMDEDPEPLKRETPVIVGNLFDRIVFLKERIDETSRMMELRKEIHKKMTEEIEADVKEKEEIEKRMADMTDKRNFKMDISALRKECRAETVRFWKDMLELKTELQELLEQHKTETKIVDIFKNLETDGLNQAVVPKLEGKAC
jgi:hypothetical protein